MPSAMAETVPSKAISWWASSSAVGTAHLAATGGRAESSTTVGAGVLGGGHLGLVVAPDDGEDAHAGDDERGPRRRPAR